MHVEPFKEPHTPFVIEFFIADNLEYFGGCVEWCLALVTDFILEPFQNGFLDLRGQPHPFVLAVTLNKGLHGFKEIFRFRRQFIAVKMVIQYCIGIVCVKFEDIIVNLFTIDGKGPLPAVCHLFELYQFIFA